MRERTHVVSESDGSAYYICFTWSGMVTLMLSISGSSNSLPPGSRYDTPEEMLVHISSTSFLFLSRLQSGPGDECRLCSHRGRLLPCYQPNAC